MNKVDDIRSRESHGKRNNQRLDKEIATRQAGVIFNDEAEMMTGIEDMCVERRGGRLRDSKEYFDRDL